MKTTAIFTDHSSSKLIKQLFRFGGLSYKNGLSDDPEYCRLIPFQDTNTHTHCISTGRQHTDRLIVCDYYSRIM